MLRTVSVGLALAVAASAAAQNVTLDAVAIAMGGKDRLLAVRTLVLEGAGDNLNFGQNLTPFAETKFTVTAYKRSYDFANRRWFLDQTRVPAFTTGNMNPQRQRTGLDGSPNGIAYNIGNNDVMARAGGTAATDRMWDFLYHPVGFLVAALRPGAEVFEEPGPAPNTRLLRTTPDGNKFAMVVDSRTSLPIRVERMLYQPMLGDVTLYTEFADWRDIGGMKLPMRITQRYENLFTLSTYQLTSSTVNVEVGNLGVTDSLRALPPAPAAAPPAPTIAVESLAPGVWLIAGQTHHTVAIEQNNQIILVEAPQSDARTLAAIEASRTLRPGKAPTWVINTHHHFDHSGGFRAAVSQGLGVITHRGNRDFYERAVFPRRHLIQPDALAQNPKPLRLTSVADKHVMRDSMRTIEIHHVPGNPHNGNMLVVYLPAERILIQADLYNPPANPPAAGAPAPVFPFVANLVDMVQKNGLQVDRVVGIHGRPVPFSELQAAAAANRTP